MGTLAERRRFLGLPAPDQLRPVMRPRRRWTTYARQSAVDEVLSQLALSSEAGGSPREALYLIASSPVRRISSLPLYYLTSLFALLLFLLVAVSLPYPLTLAAALPLILFLIAARGACLQNRFLHHIPLAESELAHMLLERTDLGERLSQAMARLPRVFSRAQIAVVRAGEEGGDLAAALHSLAREARVRQANGVLNFYRQYPILAFFLIAPLALFIMWKIYPKYVDIYSQLGGEIPTLPLAGLLSLRTWIFDVSLGFLIFTFLLCLYLDHLVRLHLGRLASALACTLAIGAIFGPLIALEGGTVQIGGSWVSQSWIFTGLLPLVGFSMPVICDRVRGLCSLASAGVARLVPWWRRRRCALERANFLGCLGFLLQRRVPAHEALRLAAPALAPAGLEGPARRAAAAVENGEPLEGILRRAKLVLPRDQAFLRLAVAGGDLPEECRRQSERLFQDAQDMIARRERVLRPFAVLAVAALGLMVLLAVYVPLFHISALMNP